MNGIWDLCLSYMDDSDLWSESGHSDTALDKDSSLVMQIWILNTEEKNLKMIYFQWFQTKAEQKVT